MSPLPGISSVMTTATSKSNHHHHHYNSPHQTNNITQSHHQQQDTLYNQSFPGTSYGLVRKPIISPTKKTIMSNLTLKNETDINTVKANLPTASSSNNNSNNSNSSSNNNNNNTATTTSNNNNNNNNHSNLTTLNENNNVNNINGLINDNKSAADGGEVNAVNQTSNNENVNKNMKKNVVANNQSDINNKLELAENKTKIIEINNTRKDDKNNNNNNRNNNNNNSSNNGQNNVNKKTDGSASNNVVVDSESNDIDNESGGKRKILLTNLNEHIICNICNGYLIDATTIVECLHSFCHSCIIKHLGNAEYCPRCDMIINTAKPNIKSDTTLQAIVYKLVPDLYDKELKRKRAYYCNKPNEAKLATPEQRGEDTEHLIFSPTENMSLSLEYADLEQLRREDVFGLKKPKYLQCPAIMTIGHLKKFVIIKFGIDTELFMIEIMYKVKTIVLSDDNKLMDIAYIYTWKRDAPMRFFFRVKETDNYSDILKQRRKIAAAIRAEKNLFQLSTATTATQSLTESFSSVSLADNFTKNETTSLKGSEANSTSNSLLISNPVIQLTKIRIKQEPFCDFSKKFDSSQDSMKLEEPIRIKTEPIESFTPVTHNLEDKSLHEFEIVPSLPSPNESKIDKLKITLQKYKKIKVVNDGKQHKKPKASRSPTPEKFEKQSKFYQTSFGETEERKQENIKMKIDISKQDSIKIINMSGPDSGVPKENIKKIKMKKESSSSSPKTSPTEKKFKALSPLSVPSITIKTEKISPRDYHCPKEKEIDLNDEETKKSEFLNSFSLLPIKSLSPDKLQKILSPIKTTDEKKVFKHYLMGPPIRPSTSSSKRKNKEPMKAIIKKPKFEFVDILTPESFKRKVAEKEAQKEAQKEADREIKNDAKILPKEAISFKLSPFPIGGTQTVQEYLKQKEVSKAEKNTLKVKDEKLKEEKIHSQHYDFAKFVKLSNNEPKLKADDMKLMPAPPPAATIGALKNTIFSKPKESKSLLSLGKKNHMLAPPGSQTPRPGMIPGSIASSKNAAAAAAAGQIALPGNRTPITGKRFPPILPKQIRPNPFANIPSDVNKMLKNSGTEIKSIAENSNVKIYAPNLPKVNALNSKLPATTLSISGNKKAQNYLNYALYNASKQRHGDQAAPPGCRTPMYTPNSPIYSPSSPQYMPNYNIPIQPTYKYTPKIAQQQQKSNATNYLQNVFGTQNSQFSSLFPEPPIKADETQFLTPPSPGEKRSNESNKRNYPFEPPASPPSEKKLNIEPVEKQIKVKSLLNSCNINIPSSLSITITNEENDTKNNGPLNSKHKSPVNNYIEILKLPPEEQNNENSDNGIPQKISNKVNNQNQDCNTKTVTTAHTPRSSPMPFRSPSAPVTTNTLMKPQPNLAINSIKNVTDNTKNADSSVTQLISKSPRDIKLPKDKKTPSPEKQKIDKSSKTDKKSPDDFKKILPKNNENLSQSTKKSPDDFKKISPKNNNENLIQPTKKFRHILPRTTTPPQQQPQQQQTDSNTKNSLPNVSKTNNMLTAKTSPKKSTPPQQKLPISNFGIVRPTSPGPLPISPSTIQPSNAKTTVKKEVISPVNGNLKQSQLSPPKNGVTTNQPQQQGIVNYENLLRQQVAAVVAAAANQQQQNQSNVSQHNLFLPNYAGQFAQFQALNFGYSNYQQAFMEQLNRIRNEAIEKCQLKIIEKSARINSASICSNNNNNNNNNNTNNNTNTNNNSNNNVSNNNNNNSNSNTNNNSNANSSSNNKTSNNNNNNSNNTNNNNNNNTNTINTKNVDKDTKISPTTVNAVKLPSDVKKT